nr:uncharacterized protein LOC123758316 isoform X1 [Procambarus clarkii]
MSWQMRCRFSSICSIRITLIVMASIVLGTLYCRILGMQASTHLTRPGKTVTQSPNISNPMQDLPWMMIQDTGQLPNTEASTLINDESKIYQYTPNNIRPIVPKKRNQVNANAYKIELTDDIGDDIQSNTKQQHLEQILEGVERIHKAARAYMEKIGYDPPQRKNFLQTKWQQAKDQQNTTKINSADQIYTQEINNTHHKSKLQETNVNFQHFRRHVLPGTHDSANITYYNTQEERSTHNSFTENSCDILLNLAPCSCTRHLTPATPCPNETIGQSQIHTKIYDEMKESTCNDWATMRGTNQSVVSFSLFGKFPSSYYSGAFTLMQRLSRVYPGWSVRFYHDLDFSDPVKKKWMCSLACKYKQLDFCYVGNLPGDLGDIQWTIGTVWRLAVMGDPLVQRFIIRDTDSPILQREVDAVQEWLNSDKCFHMMRDNPAHSEAIMGGTWGGCGTWHLEAMPRLRDLVFRWSKNKSRVSQDQINVVQLLWPTLKKSHLAHDAYWCHKFPGSRPFPSRRQNYTFVGMRSFRADYSGDRIHEPCPIQCRPAHHKDWKYC